MTGRTGGGREGEGEGRQVTRGRDSEGEEGRTGEGRGRDYGKSRPRGHF